jgi:ubiquinone/menaquinone biosynthesis C-methylase UbiE
MLKSWLTRINTRFFWELNAGRFAREKWQNRIFPQHRWLIKQIRALQPKLILEAGCGFGRNLEFLIKEGIDPKILTGLDFSRRLLSQAKRRLKGLPVKLVSGSVQHLPFADNSFDLVFTHGVLMHVKPADLAKALSELVRVAKKNLVLIEEIRPRPRQLNFFTWAHDYDSAIKRIGLKVLTSKDGQYQLRYYCLGIPGK